MKRRIVSSLFMAMVLLLLFLSASATNAAEATLTFPEEEYIVFVGKTTNIKPKLENYKGKVTYTYSSDDSAIATVNKAGAVKGLSEGNTIITCVATTADGEIEGSYQLTVRKPISSISLGKNFTLAPGISQPVNAVIKPEDATVQTLAWHSSKENIATVDENGLITVHAKGSATITAEAMDGSKKKAKITVTVKEFDVVISSIQGADVSYTTGSGMFGISYKSKNGIVDSRSGNGNSVHLTPLKPGTDTFTISVTNYMTRNTKRTTFSVFVAQDALTAPYYLAYQKDNHYYLINVTNRTVLSFSSSDNSIFSGSYTGDLLYSDRYGREVTVQYQGKTDTENIYFYDEGNDKIIVVEDSSSNEIKYGNIDVSEAEKILKETGLYEMQEII